MVCHLGGGGEEDWTSRHLTPLQYAQVGGVVTHFSVCHFREHLLTNWDTTWSVSLPFITYTMFTSIETMHSIPY